MTEVSNVGELKSVKYLPRHQGNKTRKQGQKSVSGIREYMRLHKALLNLLAQQSQEKLEDALRKYQN